jgi:ribosomal protein S27AE
VPSKTKLGKIERVRCPKCEMSMIIVEGFHSERQKFECLRCGHIERPRAHSDPPAE